MKKLNFIILFIIGLLSTNQSTAQSFIPDIVVDINGTGNFTKIQDAINAAPNVIKLRDFILHLCDF